MEESEISSAFSVHLEVFPFFYSPARWFAVHLGMSVSSFMEIDLGDFIDFGFCGAVVRVVKALDS